MERVSDHERRARIGRRAGKRFPSDCLSRPGIRIQRVSPGFSQYLGVPIDSFLEELRTLSRDK